MLLGIGVRRFAIDVFGIGAIEVVMRELVVWRFGGDGSVFGSNIPRWRLRLAEQGRRAMR